MSETLQYRLGNLVKSKKGIYRIYAMSIPEIIAIQEVSEPIGSQLGVYGTLSTIISPITLTEEWLLKTKLIQTIQNTFLMGGFELIYDSANERYNVHTLRGIITVVRYVHELQNLYFALCREELVFSSNNA